MLIEKESKSFKKLYGYRIPKWLNMSPYRFSLQLRGKGDRSEALLPLDLVGLDQSSGGWVEGRQVW